MAEDFVIKDTEESNVRWIVEPRFLARLRRLKAIWSAAVFLSKGGKFKIYLDFSGIDPRILKPVRVNIIHDGQVVELERARGNAVASASRAMESAGICLASDDEPGFRVRWRDYSRKGAWEAAGFEVSATPTEFIVTPREAHHG